ncbi:Cytochrome P450 305a1 [Carabus blaptoides fortunei]
MLNKRGKAFDMAGGTLNQFPWLRYLIPEKIGYNLLLTLNKEVEELFKGTIKQYQNTWQPGRQDNLIYSFLSERERCEENKKTFTDEQLIIVFLDLFLGATQTSGATINFVLLMMLLHPHVQAKAFEEINESLDPNKPLYYKDRVKVPYVEAIILEVSRLFPIAALAAPRRVLRDTVLDGYTVPKGSTVYANLYSVHHDDSYWCDPEVFRPERFLDGKGNVQSNDRLLNFGLGKRRCLGELLARQCIFIFFVGILRKYQICPVPNQVLPSTKPAPGIFLSPQKYKARLIARFL